MSEPDKRNQADERPPEQPPEQPPDGKSATQTKPEPAQPRTRYLPPWKVLLHNDDVNTFEHVILSILKLTPLQAEEAVQRTLEAHETGVALLLVTHQERAELYQEQFASVGIVVTIEQDEA